jgi:plastocyanin
MRVAGMTGVTGKRLDALLALAAVAAVATALAPTVAFGGSGGHGGGGPHGAGPNGDGAGGGAARSAGDHTVTLENLAFHPGTLNIDRGDSVTWVWRDGKTEHNVTFHSFHSRTQAQGSYTVRFAHTGTFSYECTLHVAEGMRGKIVVH